MNLRQSFKIKFKVKTLLMIISKPVLNMIIPHQFIYKMKTKINKII